MSPTTAPVPAPMAVPIATPTELHPEHVALACSAKKNVLTEKPMATRWADGKRMVGVMQVIRNEPSCERAGCHAHVSQQPVLGVVDIVYSLETIDRKIRSSAMRIAEFSLAFVLLAVLLGWLTDPDRNRGSDGDGH